MRDIEYDIGFESSWQSLTNELKQHLISLAEGIRTSKQTAILVPADFPIELLSASFQTPILETENGKISFIKPSHLRQALAHSITELTLLNLWDNREKLVGEFSEVAREYSESEHLRGLDSAILIALNNHYGKDVVELLAVLPTDGHLFWELFPAFCHSLPYLHVSAKELVTRLEAIQEKSKNDGFGGWLYEGVKDKCQREPQFGEQLYAELLKNVSSDVAYFLQTVLGGLESSVGSLEVHTRAIGLIDSPESRLVKVGIETCAFLNYGNREAAPLLQMTLDKLKQLEGSGRTEFLPNIVRAYGNLLVFSEDVKGCIIALSKSSEKSVQSMVARELFLKVEKHWAESWFKESLKNLATAESDKSITDSIRFSLMHYVETEPEFVVRFIESWFSNHNFKKRDELTVETHFSSIVGSLFSKQKELLEKQLTLWFNSDDYRFNVLAATTVTDLHLYKKTGLKLSKAVLDTQTPHDIRYIVQKIVGNMEGGIFPREMFELVFSVLQRAPIDTSVNGVVVGMFTEYLAYNYMGTAEDFFGEKLRAGSEVEKQIADIILHWVESYHKARRSLPPANEFRPPYRRANEFHKLQQKRNQKLFEESRDEHSFLSKIATRVVLKGGTTWFSKVEGKYTPKEPLIAYEQSVELPRGALMDANGHAYQTLMWRKIRREEA